MNFRLTLRKYLRIKGVIWLLYAIFLINTLFFVEKDELILGVLFSGVMLQLTVVRFLNNWYKLNQPRLLDWFLLGTFVSIVFNFLSLVNVFEQYDTVTVNNVTDVGVDMVMPTLLVVLIGVLGLRLGEFLVLKRQFSKVFSKEYYVFRYRSVFFLTTLLLLSIQGYLLLNGIIGYGTYEEHTTGTYSFLLQILGLLNPFFLAIYAILKYIQKYSDRVFNILFLIYFITQIVFGFLSGMKEEIITPIIIVFIPYLIGGHEISKKLIYISLVFIVLLYPINNNYRRVLNDNPGIEKTTAFQLGAFKLFNEGFIDGVTSGADSYQSRFSLFPILMYSISEEDQWTDYKYLNRYVYLPVSWFVPRFILPDKPISNTGAKLNNMLSGNDRSSVTPSTYGWAFFEGGYVFVFISFLVFGMVISYVQKRVNKENLFHLVLYITILVSLLKIESDIYFRISGLFQSIFVGYFVCLFFFKTKKYKL